MDSNQFFRELRTTLHREGFSVQTEQEGLLPVEWMGLPLCKISGGASIRYAHEDVDTLERERACQKVTDLACMVREYITLMEQAPPLKAQGLTGDFRTLAEFNGTVLAGYQTKYGVHFVTWDWSFDRKGLNQGHYYQRNHLGAKQDFAIRSGLIPKQLLFSQEQLIEIYRCCADTLDADFALTTSQEMCIKSVQEQIVSGTPDILDRMREQEQHTTDFYGQEPTM